jgi:hypothetical protein
MNLKSRRFRTNVRAKERWKVGGEAPGYPRRFKERFAVCVRPRPRPREVEPGMGNGPDGKGNARLAMVSPL